MRKILTVGYHDREAPRQWTIEREWEEQGLQIISCHTTKKGFFAKVGDLARQFREKGADADAVLVTFPGHYLVPLAWWLTRWPRKHLIFDAFLSLHDSIVTDRKLVSPFSPYAWFLYLVDYVSCHLADEVLIDTQTHRQFFIKRFHLNPERIRVIYLGSRTDLFQRKSSFQIPNSKFQILFYGTYIPLQGVATILDAAAIIQEKTPNIHFTLIGSGQEYQKIRARAEHLHLTNVTFKPFVPFHQLPQELSQADLCLGIFGKTSKAQRVIPHKVYDAVAMGIPVITEDSPAIREKFADHPGVLLCHAGDAGALASIILNASHSR